MVVTFDTLERASGAVKGSAKKRAPHVVQRIDQVSEYGTRSVANGIQISKGCMVLRRRARATGPRAQIAKW